MACRDEHPERHYCPHCHEEFVHRDHPSMDESKSALKAIIHREGPKDFTIGDVDVIGLKYTGGKTVLRLFEEKPDGSRLGEMQRKYYEILELLIKNALAHPIPGLDLSSLSGVFVWDMALKINPDGDVDFDGAPLIRRLRDKEGVRPKTRREMWEWVNCGEPAVSRNNKRRYGDKDAERSRPADIPLAAAAVTETVAAAAVVHECEARIAGGDCNAFEGVRRWGDQWLCPQHMPAMTVAEMDALPEEEVQQRLRDGKGTPADRAQMWRRRIDRPVASAPAAAAVLGASSLKETRIDPATGKGFVGYDEGDRFVHYCEVCGIEAGHGFGVAVHLGEVGRRFCSQHKPGVDPAPLAEAKPALDFNPQHEQWEWDCRTYDADGLMNPPGADGWVPWPCNRSKTASRWDGKTKSWMTPDEIYQRDHAGRGHGDRT